MLHKDVLLTVMDPGEVDIKEFQKRLVATQKLVCISIDHQKRGTHQALARIRKR